MEGRVLIIWKANEICCTSCCISESSKFSKFFIPTIIFPFTLALGVGKSISRAPELSSLAFSLGACN